MKIFRRGPFQDLLPEEIEEGADDRPRYPDGSPVLPWEVVKRFEIVHVQAGGVVRRKGVRKKDLEVEREMFRHWASQVVYRLYQLHGVRRTGYREYDLLQDWQEGWTVDDEAQLITEWMREMGRL